MTGAMNLVFGNRDGCRDTAAVVGSNVTGWGSECFEQKATFLEGPSRVAAGCVQSMQLQTCRAFWRVRVSHTKKCAGQVTN